MLPIKSAVLFLFFTISISKIFACGNEYYEVRKTVPYKNGGLDLNALLYNKGDYIPYWSHGFIQDGMDDGREIFAEKIRKLGVPIKEYSVELTWNEIQAALDKKIDYKLLSDYAWNEVKVGNRENAVKLLEILYKEHPNEYNIVANLGTACEVVGKNNEALDLLRKAVAINPQSHYGSEWIHIKILEQKVAASPDYRMILDLKADNNYQDWLAGKVYNKEIKPDSLMVQLAYQLHERIGFVPEPDPIVGQLVKDFGDLVALTHSKTDALQFYNFASAYDSAVARPQKGKEDLKTLVKADEIKEVQKSHNKLIYISIGVLLLSIVAWYVLVKKIK
jgi:tetratricopeptide (TPR) repeat protein